MVIWARLYEQQQPKKPTQKLCRGNKKNRTIQKTQSPRNQTGTEKSSIAGSQLARALLVDLVPMVFVDPMTPWVPWDRWQARIDPGYSPGANPRSASRWSAPDASVRDAMTDVAGEAGLILASWGFHGDFRGFQRDFQGKFPGASHGDEVGIEASLEMWATKTLPQSNVAAWEIPDLWSIYWFMMTGWWFSHPSEKYDFVNWDD